MRFMRFAHARSIFRFVVDPLLVGLLVLGGVLVMGGCSRTEDSAQVSGEAPPVDEETAEVARTRGVAREGGEDDPEPVPRVLLSEMSYEWRVVPEKGLMVVMEFTNPAETYQRAKGFVFLVAEYKVNASTAETGVYPWNTRMAEGVPEDFSAGSHLLFRDTQTVRAFIPYERADGCYNTLRVFVYHEDGRLITNRTYELDTTGEPGESGSFRPGFDL
jgi:hypothetical protein